jgi:isopenicillin-N N-acyltransferase-like protein
MEMTTVIDTIELAGEPRERGQAHGDQLRDELHSFYDGWMALVTDAWNTSEPDVRAYASAHIPAARAYAPDLVEEVAGIAEAAEMRFEQVFALNCFDEVICHGPDLLKAGLHGCTAFAVTGSASIDGHPYIGQGWDEPNLYPPFFFRVRDPHHPDAFVFSHPGIVAGLGMNENGLSLCWNTLKAADRGFGVPATFVVRKALQATELAELLGTVIGSQRANGMNFIVADEVQAVDIELSATKYHLTYCHGILSHANHFECANLLDFEMDLPNVVPDTLLRSGRLMDLLQARTWRIDLKTLSEEVMTDHAGGPGSICRHYCRGFETSVSIIFSPTDRKVWATRGNPCTAPFLEYDAFHPAAEATLGGVKTPAEVAV